ncbi:MAG: OsmC family protein [bacterium]
MATSEIIYKGNLRTEATHLRSGNKIITDAPVDNQGRGEYFSPTDLVATALGSCMITILGISARDQGFDIDGTQLTITKIMTENPRRIGEIVVELIFPHDSYTDQQRRLIEYTTTHCPVAQSLHPDVKKTIMITYQK